MIYKLSHPFGLHFLDKFFYKSIDFFCGGHLHSFGKLAHPLRIAYILLHIISKQNPFRLHTWKILLAQLKMRSALIVSAFFGLALAIPRPQEMDMEEIDVW